MADNILIKDATGASKTMRTVDSGTYHTPVHRIDGYDPQDDMVKVKSMQKKFRDSFIGAAVDASKWDVTLGTGGTATVASGALTFGSGTTANAAHNLLSKETFTVPFRASIGLVLSQRIVNASFYIEAVSVDATTGVPDGLHSCGFLWDGTTVTQGKYFVQNGGLTPLVSSASTMPTTAGGSVYELEPYADEVWFHGGVLDATAGRVNSYRRHQQIPDPNATYKLCLRWLNGSTAPASSTNAAIQFIACQDYAELTAEITAGRGQTVAGQAIGVAVVTMPTSNTNATLVNTPVFYADTTTNLAASATFTGTSRDGGSTPLYTAFAANIISPTAGTIRIDMSADNTNWYVAELASVTAAVPATIRSVVTARYYRVVFVNSASAQSGATFAIFSGYYRVL